LLRVIRKFSTILGISGLLVLLSLVPFLSPVSAALPAGCTSSGPGTATCTYTFYADSAASTGSQCYDTIASAQSPALDTSVPSAGSSIPGFCTVYSGPDIDITSVTANVYLGGGAPGGMDYANLFSASSLDAINANDGQAITNALLSNFLPSASCASPTIFSDVNLPVVGGSSSLTSGEVLVFVPNSGTAAAVCTGSTAGGRDTPTSLTITGTLVGSVTTVTSTTTSTVTATYTTTTTSEVTVGETTTTTIVTGACAGPSHSPADGGDQGSPQLTPVPGTPTYTVTATATSTTTYTTTTTTTQTATTTQTTEVPVTTCTATTTTTTQANGVPQFPIPNLSAIVLVALLLPVVALLARARRSSGPTLQA
jgi:hypothetical protein